MVGSNLYHIAYSTYTQSDPIKIKATLLAYKVFHLQGKKASKHAKNAFDEYDVDKDKFITEEDLKKVVVYIVLQFW